MLVRPLFCHHSRVLEDSLRDDGGEVSRFIVDFVGARGVLGDNVSNDAGPFALKRVDLDDDARPAEAGYDCVEFGDAERELLAPAELVLVERLLVGRLDAKV